MPDRTPAAARICPDCDGFATVAITLGGRNTAGHLRTVAADCRACRGTGTRPVRRAANTPVGVTA
ncbi:hypothetical protein ACFWY6_06755 [Streptomyces sp. NPDC059037]|uniref:hypothetical protein n=1 Tax=Streptomyces sp. NPDC059037 TaxID=3346710 RepID=UPI003682DFF1